MAISSFYSDCEPLISLNTFDCSDFASRALEDGTLFNVQFKMSPNRILDVACWERTKVSYTFQFRLLGRFSALVKFVSSQHLEFGLLRLSLTIVAVSYMVRARLTTNFNQIICSLESIRPCPHSGGNHGDREPGSFFICPVNHADRILCFNLIIVHSLQGLNSSMDA